MTTSESKGRFFLLNEYIRIYSHNESNLFESRIGMLYWSAMLSSQVLSAFSSTTVDAVT